MTSLSWGCVTTPTAYGFDAYNQLETLSTYRCAVTGDSASWPTTTGSPDVTTWICEEATGLLVQKKYADNLGPVYDYDIAGRVTRRTSARGLITDYTYTAWGQPDVTNYQDATPDTDTDYDRLGRKTRESNGITTSDFQYSPTTLRPTLETISYDLDRNGTPELTRQIDRSHDNLRRPTGFTLKDGTTLENQATYGYDGFSRLDSVERTGVSPARFTYSYIQNSRLIYQVIGPAHTVTNTWEPDRDVLDVKENKVGNTVISRFDYAVNAIGQRSTLSQTGTALASVRAIDWGYDSYGQLTSADSTAAGHDRAYQYDAIGNRRKSADSLTLPGVDNYTANALNQYSVIPSAPAAPTYDDDGNMTVGPLPVAPTANSTLVWDGENRLIETQVSTSGLLVRDYYDAQSRRIASTVGTATTLFIYDGWNVIAEYTIQNSSFKIQNSYLWGLDLSGTLQGAGGGGGLLCESQITNAQISKFFPTYDGNGNVSEYLSTTGTLAAHFEYDPFGNAVVNTDTTGQFNYRFSTKPLDSETGLYYYGYRYYDPLTGRWPSRDPIGEMGGVNLYGFVGNDGVDRVDIIGLDDWGAIASGFGGGNNWLPGNLEYYTPPPEPASQVANNAISDFLNGTGDLNREYGPDNTWTAAMKNHEHMTTVRDEIRSKIKTYCGGQQSGIVGTAVLRPWTLNDQSILTNARIFLNDVLAGVGLTSPVYSTGSVRFQYTINSIDCGQCTAKVDMDARDALRLSSATRIPFTNSSILNDRSTPNRRGNTINLHWYWNEEVSQN